MSTGHICITCCRLRATDPACTQLIWKRLLKKISAHFAENTPNRSPKESSHQETLSKKQLHCKKDMVTYSQHSQSIRQCHSKSHPYTTHILPVLLTLSVSKGGRTSMHTLTTEVVIEPSHQVERCFLFRGAHAPCSLRHPVPDTTPRVTPVFMETMRGHSQQPPGEVTLALAPALAASQHVFRGGVFKEPSGALDSQDDSSETVALRQSRNEGFTLPFSFRLLSLSFLCPVLQ